MNAAEGKVLGVPVYELLGGLVRDKMRTYSWVGGDRPADVIAGMKALQAGGFDHFRTNIFKCCSHIYQKPQTSTI